MPVKKDQLSKPQNKSADAPLVVEQRFAAYATDHQDDANLIIHIICLPLLMLGIFGLFWAIPFPHLKFLEQYNGYFNWASFLMAIAIYYYIKLSPVISYIILLVLLGLSYLVMALQGWQTSGGPAMWLICLVLAVIGLGGILLGNRREVAFAKKGYNLVALAMAPAYLLYLLLKKIGLKKF